MKDTIKIIENNAVKAAIEIIKKQNNSKNNFEANKYDSDITLILLSIQTLVTNVWNETLVFSKIKLTK